MQNNQPLKTTTLTKTPTSIITSITIIFLLLSLIITKPAFALIAVETRDTEGTILGFALLALPFIITTLFLITSIIISRKTNHPNKTGTTLLVWEIVCITISAGCLILSAIVFEDTTYFTSVIRGDFEYSQTQVKLKNENNIFYGEFDTDYVPTTNEAIFNVVEPVHLLMIKQPKIPEELLNSTEWKPTLPDNTTGNNNQLIPRLIVYGIFSLILAGEYVCATVLYKRNLRRRKMLIEHDNIDYTYRDNNLNNDSDNDNRQANTYQKDYREYHQ